MRDKITVYGLLSKIYNSNTDMPKKINCCGYDYEWDDDYQDYLIADNEQGLLLSFLDNHNDNLYDFLNDTVDIIKEENFTGTKGYYKGKEIWCMEYSDDEDKYKNSLRFLKDTLDQLLEENK